MLDSFNSGTVRLPTVVLVGLVLMFAGAFAGALASQVLDEQTVVAPQPVPTPAAALEPMPTLDSFRDDIRDAQAEAWGDAYAECIDQAGPIVKRRCRREADRVLP